MGKHAFLLTLLLAICTPRLLLVVAELAGDLDRHAEGDENAPLKRRPQATLPASRMQSRPEACDNVTNGDYNPHSRPARGATPWFEGWYARVSDKAATSSFAVGIGHFPDQNLSNPAAVCFILSSPTAGQPLRVHSRTFDSLRVQFPLPGRTCSETAASCAAAAAAGGGGPEDDAATTAAPGSNRVGVITDDRGDRCGTETMTPGQTGDSSNPGTTGTERGGATRGDRSGGSHGPAEEAAPLSFALTAIDSQSGDFCYWTVTPGSVDIHVRLAGARLQLRSETGACAAAAPWGGVSAPSPEGWLARVGFLLRLRYDVLSLRTPVRYVFQERAEDDSDGGSDGGDDGDGSADGGGSEGGDGGGGSAGGEFVDLDAAAKAVIEEAVGQDLAVGLRSLAEGEGPSSEGDAPAGEGVQPGSETGQRQPASLPPLWRAGLLHLEKNWGQSFPDQWVWAQGHRSTAGQQASFVLAGGLLPHNFQPFIPAVRTFVLSYHPPPPAAPFTLDPRDPPVFNSMVVQGCDGVFSVDLYGAMHVVRLVAAAPPSTFQALPCPTSTGFRNFSMESFSARVQLRVLRRPYPFAPASSASPLFEDTFEDAAMEFGGAYMCPEHMPQLAGVEDASPQSS